MRVAVVRNEKMVAEAWDISGFMRERNVHRWKPIPINGR
jgi:hypothetical protein